MLIVVVLALQLISLGYIFFEAWYVTYPFCPCLYHVDVRYSLQILRQRTIDRTGGSSSTAGGSGGNGSTAGAGGSGVTGGGASTERNGTNRCGSMTMTGGNGDTMAGDNGIENSGMVIGGYGTVNREDDAGTVYWEGKGTVNFGGLDNGPVFGRIADKGMYPWGNGTGWFLQPCIMQ